MSECPQEAGIVSTPESETPAGSAEAIPPEAREARDSLTEHEEQSAPPTEEAHANEPMLFMEPFQPEPLPPRTPHLGHVGLLGLLGILGFFGSSLVTQGALHFHLWGVSNVKAAITDVHYTIASMATLYIITFGGAALLFPPLWQKSLSGGLQWNAKGAAHRATTLLGAAGVCFILAMADEVLLPGPADAPIDKLFDTRAAAWLLFAFGVTFAPFFEEILFRGFLLPAFATAFDWAVEKASFVAPMPSDAFGHPRWSLAAMVFASVATSVPFALMHAEQTGWSLGPFLLLVVVSLILCWARLSTRSLAASVLVHASYNFLLFSLMLLGTHGFKHMEKM